MPMCGSTCWRVPTACCYAVADFATVPGDGIDGYAREVVVGLATGFAQAPRDYSHVEAASLTTAGLMAWGRRSEEHTSELQSLMRISYAVFCLKKKKNNEN